MKINLKFLAFFACGILIVFFLGCKKHIVKSSSPILIKEDTAVAVCDTDGNKYHAVTIGSQTWMIENLNATRYRNGDPIPNVSDSSLWTILFSGAYCNYMNDTGNAGTYGRLYNWFAVNDYRGLAPRGWHVATNEEWVTLVTYLEGSYLEGTRNAGDKLKEGGMWHWVQGNTGNNSTGFTALPGGDRVYTNGKFAGIHLYGKWWTATEYNDYVPGDSYKDSGLDGWFWVISYYCGGSNGYGTSKKAGFSVRCVKD
jgi:uncharacterized protein (TIGR02145 family)